MAQCSYILCEDTRVSRVLLDRYNIKKKLISFHKYSEIKLQKKILQDLKDDKIVGLISDAGTPLISDPGQNLVKSCYKENIKVEAIPGASSVIQALVLSGFDTKTFQFLGFLSKKENELNFQIKKMLFFDGTSIAFESAKRVLKTTQKIALLDPNRNVAILKEMTKKFEKRICMKAHEMENYLKNNPLKGEIVIAIEKGELLHDISIEECVKLLQSLYGLSLKEAIKMGANLKNISKKIVYKKFKVK